MKKQQLVEAYATWLDKFDFDWFGTLTFRGYPRRGKAERVFRGWTEELARKRAAHQLFWVRVAEHGAYADNLHFHFLLGGLKFGTDPTDWEDRWCELAGAADIREFDPSKGGIHYLLKTLLPDRDFDIEFDLPQARSAK
jgi:hypothetical protein